MNFPLEDEAIYILRETYAQFRKPMLLFSGGKDSITVAHLAWKAFYPAPIPFPLLHIDTGHNFPEVIQFRDSFAKEMNLQLVVRYVEDTIQNRQLTEETGKNASRNRLQTYTLLDAISELNVDACIGGARRDEEKARAKERIFSFRNEKGGWDAQNQRPEPFGILNGKIHDGENVRVFPISNWTEQDVWEYIARNNVPVPSLYFAHERSIFLRDGLIWTNNDLVYREKEEEPFQAKVRFRTVGDMTCTAALFSEASSIAEILAENASSRLSERGARIDDQFSEGAMEKRKKEGYF